MQEPMVMVHDKVRDADIALASIDSVLNTFFLTNIEHAKAIDHHYAALWTATHRLAQTGGKRIRPYITLLTYQAFTDRPLETIVPVAAAQELLHIALLIHDDIIDRDYIRHGIDNVSGQYDTLYKPFITDEIERRHFSDSAAMLAGDLLISGGHHLIQTSSLPLPMMALAAQIYGHAVFTVAGGELLDTESAFRPSKSIDAIKIARYKTAHYSFVTPLIMGAQLAEADSMIIDRLTDFGENIGIAYQLIDDLIGTFGNESVIGKSNITDIKEAKHTYLIEQLLINATTEQMTTFNRLFGKEDISSEEAAIFREMLITTGAKVRTEQAVDLYTQKALATLQTIPLDPSDRIAFEALVERAIRRSR